MILSHLSQRIVDLIVNLRDDSDQVWNLMSLLKQLLAWESKPEYLVPMAYRWCSAISKKIREQWGDEPTSEHVSSSSPFGGYARILSLSLAVGFRHIRCQWALPTRLSHTPHDEWMLDTIFTRGDDDAIADAVCVEIVDGFATRFGSWLRRLIKLTERDRPLSPRLRWTILHFVRQLGYHALRSAELEFVCLLNNLEVSVGEAGDAGRAWVSLLVCVLFTPMGQGRLSPHYWLMLGNLVSMFPRSYRARDRQAEVMKSLEGTQDWEKLETWMLVVWWSVYCPNSAPIQDIERATLTLFQQRPSAIPRFEGLLEDRTEFDIPPSFNTHKGILQRVCNHARVEQSRLGSPS
jgi:hypothetical protein